MPPERGFEHGFDPAHPVLFESHAPHAGVKAEGVDPALQQVEQPVRAEIGAHGANCGSTGRVKGCSHSGPDPSR